MLIRLNWITDKVAHCIDAKTGKRVYQARLKDSVDSANSPSTSELSNGSEQRPDAGGRGLDEGNRRGSGRGGRGGQDYASPIAAHGRLYYVGRSGEIYVIQLGAEFKLFSVNRVSPESEEYFNSTPAISDGDLIIRSSTTLYCVGSNS